MVPDEVEPMILPSQPPALPPAAQAQPPTPPRDHGAGEGAPAPPAASPSPASAATRTASPPRRTSRRISRGGASPPPAAASASAKLESPAEMPSPSTAAFLDGIGSPGRQPQVAQEEEEEGKQGKQGKQAEEKQEARRTAAPAEESGARAEGEGGPAPAPSTGSLRLELMSRQHSVDSVASVASVDSASGLIVIADGHADGAGGGGGGGGGGGSGGPVARRSSSSCSPTARWVAESDQDLWLDDGGVMAQIDASFPPTLVVHLKAQLRCARSSPPLPSPPPLALLRARLKGSCLGFLPHP
jgi:hypothetical protein